MSKIMIIRHKSLLNQIVKCKIIMKIVSKTQDSLKIKTFNMIKNSFKFQNFNNILRYLSYKEQKKSLKGQIIVQVISNVLESKILTINNKTKQKISKQYHKERQQNLINFEKRLGQFKKHVFYAFQSFLLQKRINNACLRLKTIKTEYIIQGRYSYLRAYQQDSIIKKCGKIQAQLKTKQKILYFNKKVHQITQAQNNPIEKVFHLLNQLLKQQNGKSMIQSVSSSENEFLHKFKPIINILKFQKKELLDQKTCKDILQACEIITPITPHLRTLTLSEKGEILASIKNSTLLPQETLFQTQFSSIRLSAQAILIELDFLKYKQILYMIKNNQENIYLAVLIKKFPSLSYSDAQIYLKQKQNIIDYFGTKSKSQQNQLQKNKKCQKNMGTNCQFYTYNPLQLLQNESSSLYFQLPYLGCPYLIVEGQLVLVISQLKVIQKSQQKYSNQKKIYQRRQILRLYKNDIFGIESIGQIKEYCLRYQVRKDSKILKMNNRTFKKHLKIIPNLRQQFQNIKQRRDQLLQNLLSNISQQMHKQMLKKGMQNQTITTNRSKSSPRSLKKTQFSPLQQRNEKYSEKLLNFSSQRQLSFAVQNDLADLKRMNSVHDSGSIVQKASISNEIKTNQGLKSSGKYLKPLKFDSFQFIGQKNISQMKNELQQKLKDREKQTFKSKYKKRLTVELLKQFNLIDFKEEVKINDQKKEIKNTFIEMRNQDGFLIRRKSVPSLEKLESVKNRKKVQQQIFRKIGLLNEEEQVRHNQKFVKQRKSQLKYQNTAQKQRKQFRRLHKVSQSLPRLQSFYSKKANVQYLNKNKRKFLA